MTEEQFNTFLATVKPISKKNTPAIIVDIDGTVARRTERGPHDINRMQEDETIYYTVNLAYSWVMADMRKERKILFVTGRPEKAREETKLWIDKKAFGFDPKFYELYMRPSDMSSLTGPEYKHSVYKDLIHDAYDVEFVLENSLRCCQMYRALRLNVLHVMSAKKPWSEEE